jgi:hypothetical protein
MPSGFPYFIHFFTDMSMKPWVMPILFDNTDNSAIIDESTWGQPFSKPLKLNWKLLWKIYE